MTLLGRTIFETNSLKLNFSDRIESWYHCDCVCWCSRTMGTDHLMHGSLVVETRSRRLAAAISSHPIPYSISDSDCPRPERGVLVVQIIFLQNNLFIFILLRACLHPDTPTTCTTKPHTPEPEIPNIVCHIVIILIIFLLYKTISYTDPHCVRLYINNKNQKIPRGFLFKTVSDPWANTACSQTWNVYAFHEKEDIKLI